MKMSESKFKFLLVVGAVAVVAVGVDAYAAKPGGCPHTGIECPMVWDPVICDDGEVYSNKCVARQNCAKGCVPYDDGGPIPAGEDDGCGPKPKFCPKIWAPVICDDGKVYANDCWAQKRCATGCVPYGDWLMADDGDKADCGPKPKFCPKLWAPVICDDGKVYPNDCWAQKRCATGCVPYDEGLSLDDGEKKKPGGGGDDGCPRTGWMCPMVWDPVICDDGEIYSNSCVAWVWCATGCEPYGDGGVFPLGEKAGCGPKPKRCPLLYAPVICDDGKVYTNECWAQKHCATGCVPYGEWMLPGGGEKAGGCDRPKYCPMLWAPVICDDGRVYANECWAQKRCATGCVPYDEGL